MTAPLNGGEGRTAGCEARRGPHILFLAFLVLGVLSLGTGALAAQAPSPGGPQEILAEAVRACWPPMQRVDKPVQIRLVLKADGSLAAKPQLIDPTASIGDPAAQALIVHSIQHCAPFRNLRAFRAIYREWRETTVDIPPAVQASTAMAVPQPPTPQLPTPPSPLAQQPTPQSAAGTSAGAQAAVQPGRGIQAGVLASAALAFMLVFQMMSDAGFAWQAWRDRRKSRRSRPWQTADVLLPKSSRRLSQPLDPVSDPRNWRE